MKDERRPKPRDDSGGTERCTTREWGRGGKQLRRGVRDLRATSDSVHIHVCTVPEVRGQGVHIEKAVRAANQDISRLGRVSGFGVIDMNWEVSNKREKAFEGSGIHFSPYVGRAVGWRMAGRALAFLGGPKALRARNPVRSEAKGP
ncbi:unnamed protein product [Ixodes pacificus]